MQQHQRNVQKILVQCVLKPNGWITATLPNGKKVPIYQPKKIAQSMASVKENSLFLYASAVKGGLYYKLDISILKRTEGKARRFMSWKRPDGQMVYVALFRAKSGKCVLVWDNMKEFSPFRWTPVSARQTLPTRKDGPRGLQTKKKGFVTKNPFEPLLKSEKKEEEEEEDFPPLDGVDNTATSKYNPKWGSEERKRNKDNNTVELQAKVALDEPKTDKKVKTPIFVTVVPKLNVKLPGDKSDGYGNESDGYGIESDGYGNESDNDPLYDNPHYYGYDSDAY